MSRRPRILTSPILAQAGLLAALLILAGIVLSVPRPPARFPLPPVSLEPVLSSEGWRFGIGVPYDDVSPRWIQALGAGWYLNWRTDPDPWTMRGVEYWQMVRVSENDIAPSLETLESVARRNPGMAWLVGNEPDVAAQDNVTPERYAQAYASVYRTLKEVDPTSRVGAGGITQASPLRLAYLDRVLDRYREANGVPLPVDFWAVHTFLLREQRDSWGAGIPPGLPDSDGWLLDVGDHDDAARLEAQVRAFRLWMAERGYGGMPLVVTEYGVLMPEAYGFPPESVIAFMRETFAFFLTASDSSLGDPADGGRLVQRWSWFSLADPNYPTGNLIDPQAGTLTPIGWAYREFVAALP